GAALLRRHGPAVPPRLIGTLRLLEREV
ncbi:MAG: hypothetical protein QOI76_2809, partial [Frankiales bacterium]|nr:hypothetical protein [Frankiales bacterium]